MVIFISGDSGEGKSYTALRIQEILCKLQGVDFPTYMPDMNVFTPFEYAPKLKNLLFNKEYKDINIICMHEARDVVKAKNWQSFLNQAIADVNAMSRSVKRLVFIIVSQFIRDVSTDIRYTFNYYITCNRPLGKSVQIKIQKMYKDDHELEKPKLLKRKIRGYIKDKETNKQHLYVPEYIEMSKPEYEICKHFDQLDFEAKTKVIHAKMEKLIQQLSQEHDMENNKVNTMVDWYIKNPVQIQLIGKTTRKKWRLKPEAKIMHGLTESECSDFEKKMGEAIKLKQKNNLFDETDGVEGVERIEGDDDGK